MASGESQARDWTIETGLPEDAQKIAAMHSESFRKTYLKDGDDQHNQEVIDEATRFVSAEGLEKRAELLTHALKHSDRHFYEVAINEDNEVLGLIYGTKRDEKQEIHALYVDERYHGAGVAKALVESYIDWADPTRPIELGVVVDNERAKRFYLKMGFEALNDKRESYYDFLPETTMKRKGDSEMVEFEPVRTFTITEMTEDDIDSASLMRKQSWIDTYVNADYGISAEWIDEHFKEKLQPENFEQRKQRFLEGKESGNFNAWVVKNAEGEIVGSATPFLEPDGRQRVGSIYVDKKWHGTGVGSHLMQKVIDWFDPDKPIYLEVVTYNDRAKAFYRKWGFEEIPNSEAVYAGTLPEVTMIRSPENERKENE